MTKQVRGDVIKGYVKYIKKRWGQAGVDSFETYASMDLRDLKDKDWYDSDLLKKIHFWLAEKGDKYVPLSSSYCVQNLGMLSYIVKFLNIKTLLQKVPKSFEDGFSYGSLTIDIKDKKAIAKFKDVVIDKYTCAAWKGAFEGALLATNTKGTVKPIQEKDMGDNDCYFLIEWD